MTGERRVITRESQRDDVLRDIEGELVDEKAYTYAAPEGATHSSRVRRCIICALG
ncbi:hypothetical protein [Cupriavidus sp. 8B]